MPSKVVDGKMRFGVSLADFYRQEDLVIQASRRGVLIPPISEVAGDVPPALAYVNPLPDGSVRWIADCPSCLEHGRRSAQYVWLDTPLLFCMRCANAVIGGLWRHVFVPPSYREIERLVLLRPNPETRAWEPSETLADLREQNAMLGIGG